MQSIYFKYKGCNIKDTNINTINKNKIMIFLTSNTGNYNDNPLITNNNVTGITTTTAIKQ